MINDLALGFGFVAVVEGLLLVLAPGRLGEVLEMLQALGPDRMRTLGLAAVALGVGLVWLGRA